MSTPIRINKNITIYQGATFSVNFTAKTSAGDAIDLSGYGIRSHMRAEYTSTTNTVFTATIVSPATSGIVNIALTATQTAALKPGRQVYDIEIIDLDSNVIRLVQGNATIYPEVTK